MIRPGGVAKPLTPSRVVKIKKTKKNKKSKP